MPDQPALFVVTGIMAAGKSTVAQALAERFDRGVHVRGDQLRRAIVRGRVDMSPDATPEALGQLRLRYRLAAEVADRYVAAGFSTVVQDTILGPMLPEALDFYSTRPLALVVLAPTPEAVAEREAGRAKTGYGSFTPHQLDAVIRNDTPKLGLWIDSTELTAAQTVDAILERRSEAIVDTAR